MLPHSSAKHGDQKAATNAKKSLISMPTATEHSQHLKNINAAENFRSLTTPSVLL